MLEAALPRVCLKPVPPNGSPFFQLWKVVNVCLLSPKSIMCDHGGLAVRDRVCVTLTQKEKNRNKGL
jgi:hypothetical protein